MTAQALNKSVGCLWIFIALAALIGIIASCHPLTGKDTSSPVASVPAYSYTAFKSPTLFVLGPGQKSVNYREGPGKAYTVSGQISNGQDIMGLGESSAEVGAGWLVIQLDAGKFGYIRRSLVVPKPSVGESRIPSASSFKCAKSVDPIEQLICGDAALAKSDVTMTSLYQPLLASLSGQNRIDLVNEQKEWLKSRSKCFQDPEPKKCIGEQYQVRILNLQLTDANLNGGEETTPSLTADEFSKTNL